MPVLPSFKFEFPAYDHDQPRPQQTSSMTSTFIHVSKMQHNSGARPLLNFESRPRKSICHSGSVVGNASDAV